MEGRGPVPFFATRRGPSLCSASMARSTQKPPHVGTIGGVIRDRHAMMIYCESHTCLHGAPVDLEALRDRLGSDYRVADFVARSVCSKCGARWPKISIKVSHASGPTVIRPHPVFPAPSGQDPK